MTGVINISGLQVAYGGHQVLRGIDLRVTAGERLLILGGSGCGKSTLLKSIVGLIPHSTGNIEVFGSQPAQLGEAANHTLLRRIGVMFQYGALLNSLSVGANIALPLEMHTDLSADLIEHIVRARLQLVGLDGTSSLLPAELSGGMRKRAALARAMVMDPDILLCDEPGAGLDPVTAAEIDRLLLMVNETLSTTLIVVTHELLSIQRLDGRLVMLDEGRIVFTGTSAAAGESSLPVIRNFFRPGE